MIIDNRIVLLGSSNFSDGSFTESNEANIIINDNIIVNKFSKYFLSLWNKHEKEEKPLTVIKRIRILLGKMKKIVLRTLLNKNVYRNATEN